MNKKYTIIQRELAGDLEDLINEYIDKGWYPMGGITFANNKFYQAMVNVSKIKEGM